MLVLPQSLGRLHQRRGLTARIVRDAPGSAVGLAWVTDRYDDLTEEFIGIVRGRTATSSRGRGAPPPPEPTRPRSHADGVGQGRVGQGDLRQGHVRQERVRQGHVEQGRFRTVVVDPLVVEEAQPPQAPPGPLTHPHARTRRATKP